MAVSSGFPTSTAMAIVARLDPVSFLHCGLNSVYAHAIRKVSSTCEISPGDLMASRKET